jgi:hypothetical protein
MNRLTTRDLVICITLLALTFIAEYATIFF